MLANHTRIDHLVPFGFRPVHNVLIRLINTTKHTEETRRPMRKTTVLSAITLLLCVLVGYAAFQAANLVKNLISDRLNACHSETQRGCGQQNSLSTERGPQRP